MSNIKILISCHKPSMVPDSEMIRPIEVGAALREHHIEGALRDDTGDNISRKNKMYCELTAQYWAWKNLDADYYGFFHYRRYLSFSEEHFPTNVWQNVEETTPSKAVLEKYHIDDAHIHDRTEPYDIVLSEEKNVAKMPDGHGSVYGQYKHGEFLNSRDLDTVREIIAEKYPDYLVTFDRLMQGKKTCLCNMYIMKKAIFHQYMAWLFDILFEFEKRTDMRAYTAEGYRTPGHLAERLLTVFCWYAESTQQLKIRRQQTIIFMEADQKKSLSEIQKTLPAYPENNIAIAVAANDVFIPYCGTLLRSLAEHTQAQKNYDILLLSQDVSDANVKRLQKMLAGWENISLRVIDPGVLLDQYSFYVRGHFSKETYYRLVLPELLPHYDKVLYLDSDMAVQQDVAEIYEEQLDGYLVAACLDADTAGLYNGYHKDKKQYTDEVLKLQDPYKYFQAGVLLLNLQAFRETFTTKQILDFAVSEKWQLLDQDILNKLCEGRVRFLDMRWNVMTDYAGVRIRKIIPMAPHALSEMYFEARKHPAILHYAGPNKPWYDPETDFADIFWEYARRTPFYEIMLARMSRRIAKRSGGNAFLRSGSLVARGLQCVADHGLGYTLIYLRTKLTNGKL